LTIHVHYQVIESIDDEHEKLNLATAMPVPEQQSGEKPPKVYPQLNAKLRIAMWCALIGGPIALAMASYEFYRGKQLKSVGKEVVGNLFSSETLNTGKGRISYQVVVDICRPEVIQNIGNSSLSPKMSTTRQNPLANAKSFICQATHSSRLLASQRLRLPR